MCLETDESAMLFSGNYWGDPPRMDTRGMMLDISRNYYGVESVLKMLDVMAELSLNQLHLRLTDDEGWRIAIDGLEELTKVGGARCFDPTETECIMPQHGSGPEKTDGAGSGHLTKKDYESILDKGKKLGIRIVPEIVAPSHSAAAITAMKNAVKDNGEPWRLLDEDQVDESQSVQGFYDNTLNPCLDDTYEFLEKVVNSIADMHKDYINEGLHNHFHIG